MPSEKTEVVIYEGTAAAQIGDILWYDGDDWVRLSAGTEGQILTVVDLNFLDYVPQWQDAPAGITL